MREDNQKQTQTRATGREKIKDGEMFICGEKKSLCAKIKNLTIPNLADRLVSRKKKKVIYFFQLDAVITYPLYNFLA